MKEKPEHRIGKAGRSFAGRGKIALIVAACVAVPFAGIYMGTAASGKTRGGKILSARAFILLGVVSLLIYAAAGAWLVKTRDAKMVAGCASALGEMRVLEEQYLISEGGYTESIADLARMKREMGSWMCEGVSPETCAERYGKKVSRYCRIKTLETILEPDRKGYEIKVRARNTGNCPICATPVEHGPVKIQDCTGLKDYTCRLNK